MATLPDEVSAYVVAAMCGCWKRESGVNPGVWESLIPCAWDYQYEYLNKGGYGLGQWTNVNTPHGRCWNLYQYCQSHRIDVNRIENQIAFLLEEDNWDQYDNPLNATSLQEFLESDSQNLSDLVETFLACWEGVPGDAFSERLEAAEHFLDFILENADSSTTWIEYNENRYIGFLSDEQLNNVMLIYHQFNGAVPTPVESNKSKFWIYLKPPYRRIII